MKIAVGSDERNETTDAVVAELRCRGIEVELHGPRAALCPDAETARVNSLDV